MYKYKLFTLVFLFSLSAFAGLPGQQFTDSPVPFDLARDDLSASKPPRTLLVGLIGPGQVGKALLRQIDSVRNQLKATMNLDIRVVGAISSQKMKFISNGASCEELAYPLDGPAGDLGLFVKHVKDSALKINATPVLIDCSSSEGVAAQYPAWLKQSIAVVAANKKAISSSQALYDKIQAAQKHAPFFHEATVGAGLPIFTTLADMQKTGDSIVEIEGVVSGTLSFIFNQYRGTKKFSELLKETMHLGYTEPDFREDLSGLDVARKAVILARKLGVRVELDQISVDSLVPSELQNQPFSKTMANNLSDQFAGFDEQMRQRRKEAEIRGKVLRYAIKVRSDGQVSVGLLEFALDHPFATLQANDNMIVVRSQRYQRRPLVIQGPGAGAEVTAAAVLGDLLRIAP